MSSRPRPMRPLLSNSNPPLPKTHTNSTQPVHRQPVYSKRQENLGPSVTEFVGSITERAPDVMVRHILNTCGHVLSWKRVQGASGKLQAFGFCEFGNPDAALRVIRLLNDYEIADKKLVVKADAKTKEVLEEYKDIRKKAKQNGDSSPLQDEKADEDDEDDYLDEETAREDQIAMQRINSILMEHKKDIT